MGFRGRCKAKRILGRTKWESAVLYYNGSEDSTKAKKLIEQKGVNYIALKVDASPLEDHKEITFGKPPILILGRGKDNIFIGLEKIKEVLG